MTVRSLAGVEGCKKADNGLVPSSYFLLPPDSRLDEKPRSVEDLTLTSTCPNDEDEERSGGVSVTKRSVDDGLGSS